MILVILLLTWPLTAQIKDIVASKDSTIIINNTYAGLFSQSEFSQDSLNFSGLTTVRVGFRATYQPLQSWSITSEGMEQINDRGGIMTAYKFWAKFQMKNISVESGFLPSLTAESRPAPTTANGQFETWTENTIPGAALGAKMRYCFSGSNISIGVFQRNESAEYQAQFANQYLCLTAYYSEFARAFGSVMTLKTDRLSNKISFNPKKDIYSGKVIADCFCADLIRKHGIDFFFDVGYGLKEKKMIKAETGIFKKFSENLLKGLFGIGYCYEQKTINGYLFIHI